jgi:hypothetical protein
LTADYEPDEQSIEPDDTNEPDADDERRQWNPDAGKNRTILLADRRRNCKLLRLTKMVNSRL